MNKAINFILDNKLLNNNDYVVIALSGGPDSMYLLQVLLEIRKNININIVCAHVNHNLRKESDDERVFVEKYCNDNNILFEYMKINSYEKGNTEMIARVKRYEFFKKVLHKYNSKILFVAHHGDDLIETVMMRIVRGTNTNGYIGFKSITNVEDYKIVRPLVYNTKEDIIKYLDESKIPYVIDESNYNLKYTRNRYRHKILPILKEENKNVHLKFLKFSENISECCDYVDNISLKVLDSVYNSNILNLELIRKEELIIQKRVVNLILKSVYNNNINLINDTHIYSIINIINSDKSNIRLSLPSKIIALKEYNNLRFVDNMNEEFEYKIELNKDVVLFNNRKISFINDTKLDTNYICRLNSDDICLPLYVRCKKDGDKMYVKNLNGSKKVKDIFINEKVDISKRNMYPIVVDSNDTIVWIPGLKKSKYNKEISEKCDIILKYN